MNRRATLLFLLYLCAILYISLYPAHPGLPPMASSLRWHPILYRGELLDFLLNIVFYVPLGAAACIALRRGALAIFGATLACALISLAVEYAQLSIPSRDADLRDLTANTLGALSGAALAFVTRRFRAPAPSVTVFLGLWIAWQAFMVLRRPWSLADVMGELVGLLVLAMVLTRKISRWAAPLLLIWLAVEELRPFQFASPPGPFSWIPFEGWFARSPDSYYGILGAKLFLYTGIVWVLRRSSAPMIWAVAIPGIVLAAGEYAQRYLPGRTPEITDLVLLAAGGALLHLTCADR